MSKLEEEVQQEKTVDVLECSTVRWFSFIDFIGFFGGFMGFCSFLGFLGF